MKIYAIEKYSSYEKGFVMESLVSNKEKAVNKIKALLAKGDGQYEWACPIPDPCDHLVHFATTTEETILSYEFPCNGGTYKVKEIEVE